MKKTVTSTLTVAGTLFAFAQGAAAADCGSITISEMNWASAELVANIDKIILEEGFGCDVELIAGATSPTFASMNEKAQPDVAPELWINAVANQLASAKEEGRMAALNDNVIQGIGEGWFVTPSFIEAHPELDTVEKIIEHPELFPFAEDPSKGAYMGCPAGWACQHTNGNIFKAFGMEEKGWVLVDPGSAAGLDGAIAKAAERGENWFGYYWSPTAIIGRYKLQQIPFETEWAGKDNWDNCMVDPECENPMKTPYVASAVETVVTSQFLEKAGEDAAGYFKTRSFPSDAMNGMLVYMNENQATGEDAAFEFLEKHMDVWTPWVSPEAAEKIKGAL